MRAVKGSLATPSEEMEKPDGNERVASLTVHNRGSTRLPLKRKASELGKIGGWPVDLLCSRNTWPQKALVERAQLETKQPTLPEETTSKLGGSYLLGGLVDARAGKGRRE